MGIKGSEAADKSAKQACITLDSPVPYSDLKLAVNSFIKEKWQREWDGQTENKLKEIKPYIAISQHSLPEKLMLFLHA